MYKEPCYEGQVFELKDGRTATIYMVCKPGNGYSVYYTIAGVEYKDFPFNKEPLLPWYKFRKMIKPGAAPTPST